MDIDAAAVEPVDYPLMFRQMIVRSTKAALVAIEPKAVKLRDEARERSLYALSKALYLVDAWPAAGDLVLTLAPHIEKRGVGRDWIDYLDKAAAQAAAQQDIYREAQLHLQTGRVYVRLDEYDAAEKHLLEAHKCAQKIGDNDIQAKALHLLALTAAETGDFQRARSLLEQILPIALDDSPVRGHCYTVLGLCAMRQGDWQAAIRWYQLGLQVLTAVGEARQVGEAERTLATAHRYTKQYGEALAHYQRSLQVLGTLDTPFEQATTQMEMGVTHWYLGQHEEALSHFAECEPVFVAHRSKLLLGHLYNNRGLALRDLDRTGEAHDAFLASIEIMRELGLPLWVANALESLGGLYQRGGDLDKAVATWEQALSELASLPEMPQYLHGLLISRIAEARSKQENPARGSRVDSPA